MSRILIPRSDNISAKPIESNDQTDLLGCVLTDHVVCGFTLSVGSGTRAIDVALGKARVLGLHLNNSASCCCAITCLAVCDVHSIYIQVCKDACGNPDEWTFTSNTTDTTPTDAFKIGTATTTCSGTTAGVTTCGTAKETTIAQGTAFPTDFITDKLFFRTDQSAIYDNTGTEAVPIMTPVTLRSSPCGLPDVRSACSIIHIQSKQNGFFYSDGCNWFCVDCNLSWDLASAPDITNCFDCGAEWTEQDSCLVSVDCMTAGVMDAFLTSNALCNVAATADIGGACFICDCTWVFRFKLDIKCIGSGASGTPNQAWVGFSDEDSASDHANLKDFLGIEIYTNTTQGSRINVARTQGTSMASACVDCCNWQAVSTGVYYIEVSRLSGNATVKSYLGSGASTFSDSALLTTATTATGAGLVSLRYFGLWNKNNIGSGNGDIDVHIDELKVFDGKVRIA